MRTLKASDLIEFMLRDNNKKLSEHFKSHTIILRSPIHLGLDNIVRDEIENIFESSADKKSTLVVILETTGGYIEVVERIYKVFRNHFDKVFFVVPNYAYSAGTVLVLSGDEIYMDYYSVLGPIDPQIENEEGKVVPGHGYLAKFDELTQRINKAKKGDVTRAELAYLVKRFDPATLFLLEQAKNHSRTLLIEWLSKHKFKDWKTTEGAGKKVTEEMRQERAGSIAEILAKPEKWHSHGRGIGIRELTGDDIKLKIIDFGADEALNKMVRSYYDLFTDYCSRQGARSAIHTERGLRRIQ